MSIRSAMLAVCTCLGLAACSGTDLERGLLGAGAGAVVAKSTGTDVLGGAAIGGAAGVVCDDLTPQLCQNR